jgi:hypothetical protein
MQLTQYSFTLVLLCLPGYLCLCVIKSLTTYDDDKVAHWLLKSVLLAVVSYLVYFAGLSVFNTLKPTQVTFHFAAAVAGKESGADMRELALVTVTAVIIGFILAYAVNKKWLVRIALKLGATRQFGDADVWTYMMHDATYRGWVVVRDEGSDRSYWGWIAAYSEKAEAKELLLLNAKVYVNSTATFLYDAAWMYLSEKDTRLIVESGQPVDKQASADGRLQGDNHA